jgi:transcriptional regulator with XRE-family HTH domain
METMANNTGEKVRALRKERGLYQHEVAAIANLSTQTVRNVEAGRTVPDTATLVKLASALKVSVAELVG